MRVVANVPSVAPSGGVEVQLFEVARELTGRGHQFHVCYQYGGALEAEYRSFGAQLTKVPSFGAGAGRPLSRVMGLVPAVAAAVRGRPDVVYLQTSYALAFGVPTALAARAPLVCHVHGVRVPGRVATRLMRHVDRYIAVSRFVRNGWIELGVDPDRIEVVPNGIDPAVFAPTSADGQRRARSELGLSSDAFVVLFLGRLDPEKGLDLLFEAWRHLGMPPEEAHLVVQGSTADPRDDEARRRRLDAAAPPGCRWVPARRDVVTALHAADAVAVPTLVEESFGRVVVESLACGVPAVAARVGGIPEILDGPLEHLLFERGDAAALAERLRSLMGWRTTRPELAEQCTERVAGRFSLLAMADGIERILERAARRGR